MTEENKTIEIPEAELKGWLIKIENGRNPKVEYSEDPLQLAKDALAEKDKALYYINHRIQSFIHISK